MAFNIMCMYIQVLFCFCFPPHWDKWWDFHGEMVLEFTWQVLEGLIFKLCWHFGVFFSLFLGERRMFFGVAVLVWYRHKPPHKPAEFPSRFPVT